MRNGEQEKQRQAWSVKEDEQVDVNAVKEDEQVDVNAAGCKARRQRGRNT